MTDGLSRTYADLLEGQPDSLDRIVLNAYFRFACRPAFASGGGSCTAGKRLSTICSCEVWRAASGGGSAPGPPRTRFRSSGASLGKRSIEIAAAYRKTTPVQQGLLLILEGRGPAAVCEVLGKGYLRRQQPFPFIYYYSFHILDPDWGHLVIRMSSHAPFSAQILLNGHEYVERQAQKAGVSFTKEGNCFTHLENTNRFAKLPRPEPIRPLWND